MTTPTSYIAPDGKLYTYKQYVNWSGYRPVEGIQGTHSPGFKITKMMASLICIRLKYDNTVPMTFLIQD